MRNICRGLPYPLYPGGKEPGETRWQSFISLLQTTYFKLCLNWITNTVSTLQTYLKRNMVHYQIWVHSCSHALMSYFRSMCSLQCLHSYALLLEQPAQTALWWTVSLLSEFLCHFLWQHSNFWTLLKFMCDCFLTLAETIAWVWSFSFECVFKKALFLQLLLMMLIAQKLHTWPLNFISQMMTINISCL